MDLILQDEEVKRAQRQANKERKRAIKRLLREQVQKGTLGGHDRTGTRVTDATPLPKQAQPPPPPVKPPVKPGADAAASAAPSSPTKDACTETPETASIAPCEMPLCPTQELPRRSRRRRNPEPCDVLRNANQILGRGSFGVVYMGLNKANGELVAVKEIPLQRCSPADVAEVVREMTLMKRLRHPNIVRYYGAARNDAGLQLFLEYVPGGSLQRIVRHFGRLEERVVRLYGRQMLRGLAYLHAEEVAHLDVKSDNALLGVTGEVKLADFGASQRLEHLSAKPVGTPAFMAPEVIRGTGYALSADIWSLGITLLELLTGAPPTYGLVDASAIMYKVASMTGPPPMPDGATPECLGLLAACLSRHPLDRPTAEEVLQAPFMAEAESDSEGEADEKPTNTMGHTPMVQPAWEEAPKGTGAAAAPAQQPQPQKPKTCLPAGAAAAAAVNGGRDSGEEEQPCTLRSIRDFVSSPGLKHVSNNVADLVYLRSLSEQKKRGVISEFELRTRQAKLFGMSAPHGLVPCGLVVDDV